MSYGYLNLKQRAALKAHVRGKRITDYGAGDLSLAQEMLVMGAEHVLALDKTKVRPKAPAGVTFKQGYFHDFKGPFEHLFLSWPVNYVSVPTVKAVLEAQTVVYLGKNTDGCACGTPDLFEAFIRRKVLAYVPDRINTLIIYGKILSNKASSREPLPEEKAGLTAHTSDILAYESIEN